MNSKRHALIKFLAAITATMSVNPAAVAAENLYLTNLGEK
jgi:hypothetical protein